MPNTGKKPKHRFWRGTILPRLALTVWPLPKNTFCSIDVTNRCNLRCKHCYFFSYEQERGAELSQEEWLARIDAMQRGRGAFFSCTWVGGEPLLRPEIIAAGRRFFRNNRVVTNGTLPLPDWPDVEFHVSVDGTEALHDAIRGAGCYAKIRANLTKPEYVDRQIVLACCLNRANIDCIEELIADWKGLPNIRHILFDFFTPITGIKEELWLTFAERDRVVDRLEALKRKHGDFIGAPPGTFSLMRSENCHRAVGRNCVFVRNGTAFDAAGNVKTPCVIGPKADCAKCGCIVPFSVKAWKRPANLLREVGREIRKALK